MSWRVLGALVVLLVVLTGATSCARSSDRAETDRRQIESGDPSVEGRNAELEELVRQSREVATLYDDAASVEAGPCMRKAGFDYWEPTITGDGTPVVVDPEHPGANREDPQARNAAYVQTLSEAEQDEYSRALLGDEAEDAPIEIEDESGEVAVEIMSGGCLGEARANVMSAGTFAEVQTFLFQMETLPLDVTSRVRESEEYLDLSTSLLRCVRGRGIDAADVGADPSTFGELGEEGVKAATACSEELHIAEPLASLRDAAAAVVLVDNASLVSDWGSSYRDLITPLRRRLGLDG